ncbi:Zinc finger MYM-type protein 1 [Dissostichus eleginoides]|uniref:Zinc finger MYM-type protein 1 n=1 Tax=Dissostichus eleginoides TaxID=100907 RepID=A0AAD9EZV2_DISEL|nr:Zinc finger MYM-type protein 1 [Dissostichus eleginoides]
MYYTTTTRAGIKLPRTWLCYSPTLDCAYCEPCWLFADRGAPFYSDAWVKGVRDWQHLSARIDSHAQSQVHVGACVIYEQWKKNGRIDANMERNARNAANYWRQVLERIVNVTITLATCNLAFRGHREILGQPNSGNFLSMIELLACYDPVLKELVQRPQGSVKYLSPAVQNEIIYIIAKRVQCDIQVEINNAPFFSVIMDTTQDISKRDQISQVYRYVTIQRDENDNAKDILINEAFLGFVETVDTSARELQKKILDGIESNGFDLSKCRGQGYSGAANMSGVYSGVQARIMEMEPLAKYVHYAAHNLNLTLNDSVKNIV